MKLALPVAATVLMLAGCAQSPESIQPAYVSSVPYQGWTCGQLSEEEAHLGSALAAASAQQNHARTSDALSWMFIGFPIASMTGENVAPQVAQLKGELDAVQTAEIRNSCAGGSPDGPAVIPYPHRRTLTTSYDPIAPDAPMW